MKNPFLVFKKRAIDSRTLQENEYSANKALAFGCAFGSFLMLLIWVFYITGVFELGMQSIMTILNIVIPISMVLLLTPLFFYKTKYIKQPWFKYYLLSLFIFVVSVINVIIPKHSLLGWAVIIVLACHYYSPRTSLAIFISVSIMMLLCMYFAMLFGEWDPYLMGGMDNTGIDESMKIETSDVNERIEYLNSLMQYGENRYVKIVVYYYMSRMVLLTLMFFISLQLTIRTEKLLKKDSDFTKDKEKIAAELGIASNIQVGILPREFPNTSEFELYAIMDPAKEVGGDFYDFYMCNPHELIFTIGDVSGKGVPAALEMMGTKTFLKSVTKTGIYLEKALELANQELYQFNQSGLFVTAVTARLNILTGELIVANAGHNPILIKRNNKYEYVKLPRGFVLGGLEETKFKATSFKLLPGDQIFFYTDGVTEATNANEEIFGEERLLNILNANPDLNPEELTKVVQAEINKFVNGEDQFDDITIISVLFKGTPILKKEISVDSLSENLDVVTEFVNDFLSKVTNNKKAIYQINVAIDELFSNIVKFAYNPEVGKAIVRIELKEEPVSVSISFVDNGRPFNPLELENPDITLDASERQIGGLGIFIVKQSMDEISYEYKNNQNILTIKKNL